MPYASDHAIPRGLIFAFILGGFSLLAPFQAAAANLTMWGYNETGQKDEPLPLSDCTDFSNSYGTSLCLRPDGSVKGWGYDAYDQVSDLPTATGFIDIASGCYTGYAIDPSGVIVGWGSDNYNEITDIPDAVSDGPFAAVSAFCDGAFALNANGEIFAWGSDSEGLVSGVPSGSGFTKVAANYSPSAFALRSDGSIAAWGYDGYGLVSGAPTGAGFIDVGVSYYGAAAVASDGSLVAWGDEPSLISDLPSGNDFTAVACTSYEPTACFALRTDGSIAAWGYDDSGSVSDAPTDSGYTAIFGGIFLGAAIRAPTPPLTYGVHPESSKMKFGRGASGLDFLSMRGGFEMASWDPDTCDFDLTISNVNGPVVAFSAPAGTTAKRGRTCSVLKDKAAKKTGGLQRLQVCTMKTPGKMRFNLKGFDDFDALATEAEMTIELTTCGTTFTRSTTWRQVREGWILPRSTWDP